ncbi:MAG: PAS domain S-box protein, partial [Ginsengibacter sp.]
PDDRNALIEEWNNKSKKGLKSSLEYRLINKKGNIRWVSGEAVPLFNNTRKITGYIGTLSDITERKKADEALRLAQFTIENTTHAIYWIKSDGSFHMVNNAATQMLGFTFEELMQRNVPGIDPFYNKEVWDGFWQAIIKEKFMRLITKHIRKDGTLIDVQIDTHYFRFENLEMSCAFVSDITERKTAETLLKNSEEKYRQIVETAQEGIWLVNENNETVFVNKRMADMLEYTVDEMMGKQNYYFIDDEEKKNAIEQIKRRKAGISENHDAKFITKSGRVVWTNLSTNPVFDENGKYKGALAMITDITERKLHHELLKKSEADLEIKNNQLEIKNKEMEQFAYIASHDLQEPLRTTSSFVGLLQKQYKGQLDERADKYFNYILDASDRMKALIKNLLDYSRIGNKKDLEQVDCKAVLQDVLADLHVAIQEAKADISYVPLPVINGYPNEIKQLFQNLLINAIKFRKKDTVPQIIISVQKSDSAWEFIFKDNGIGIAEEHREKIFNIFQRLHTRTEYEGSGIGLSYCKKIVELHHGKIWIESTPGLGSTFHFTIHINKGIKNNTYKEVMNNISV